jgi:hypothetical protein
MMVAYPDVAWTKGAYRNVRRALFEVAWPIGRAKDPPGRPLIWRALKIYRDRENQTARGGVMPLSEAPIPRTRRACWSDVIDLCVICRAMARKHLGVSHASHSLHGKMSAVRTIQSSGDALFRQPTDAALHVRE